MTNIGADEMELANARNRANPVGISSRTISDTNIDRLMQDAAVFGIEPPQSLYEDFDRIQKMPNNKARAIRKERLWRQFNYWQKKIKLQMNKITMQDAKYYGESPAHKLMRNTDEEADAQIKKILAKKGASASV